MKESTSLTDLRNDVLRKIGRNVVNLQKMEGMLKFLMSLQSFSGAPSEFERIAREAAASTARRAMGSLVTAFVRSFYEPDKESAAVSRASRGITATVSVKIESDAKLAKERRKALSSVVAQRNKLIHQTLAAFDPKSEASCVELAIALDAQHAKLWPEFEMLKSLVLAVKESTHELGQYVASDEFLRDLKRAT